MLITNSKFLYLSALLFIAASLSKNATAESSASALTVLDSGMTCSAVTGTLGRNSTAPSADAQTGAVAGNSNTNVNAAEEQPEAKPANPVRKTCAGGKVRMIVGITPTDVEGNPASHRHFGHTIMDKIPLTVVLDLDPTVKLDFSSLVQQNVIGFAGSDFSLYKAADGEPPAVSISGPTIRSGRSVYVINLIVQTSVFKPSVVFNLDLRYATEMLPSGKAPKWLPMTTPDFLVSKMTVVDNGTELQEGDLGQKAERTPWPAVYALALGTTLILLHGAMRLVKWLSRIRPRKEVAPNRLAWTVFEANYKEGTAGGFRVKHLIAFSHALRRYLASLPQYKHIDALTITEIGSHFPDAEPRQLEIIVRVLTVFEDEIFAGGDSRTAETAIALSKESLEKLFNDLETLVPRTWDSTE